MRHLLTVTLLLAPAACLSQETSRSVSPGMTEAQVVTALGQPATRRSVGERTYMFYANSCGKRCGMNDLVILNRDSVVDAIFRSPERHYTGTSSSPDSVSPKEAAKSAPSSAPARMKPPAKASDATPSIPVSPATMTPAPTSPTPPHSP